MKRPGHELRARSKFFSAGDDMSTDVHWITDQDISDEIFEGLPVPGDNTVTIGRNRALKRQVTRRIRLLLRLVPPTDSDEIVKLYALILYKRLLEDDMSDPVRLDEDALMISQIRNVLKAPPLASINRGQVRRT